MTTGRRQAVATVVVLWSVALAGCAGGVLTDESGNGGDGDGESTAPVVEAEPSVYVAADRGFLRGAGA